MAESSKERIAAALALAEELDASARIHTIQSLHPEVAERLNAYRATAPKLRTRAEVDAELVSATRLWVSDANPDSWCRVQILCREPTADPHEPGCKSCGANTFEPHRPDCSEYSYDEAHAAERCSCDESERLHGYMQDIKALHRVWSDNKADPSRTLTCVGHILMRWMSNLP